MANKPLHEIRFGLIKVSIWKNHTKAGDRFTSVPVRLFKDGENWRESTRFGRDDLPLLAKAVDQAHSWIYAQTQREQTNGE